jgi:hypothetical protein
MWIPTSAEYRLLKMAKKEARSASQDGAIPEVSQNAINNSKYSSIEPAYKQTATRQCWHG